MSERWKPMKGETYWVVGRDATIHKFKWSSDGYDSDHYDIGNCFKTEIEAQAAAENVKALLLGLYKPATECNQLVTICNQLPKLTAEVFNRHDCPEWAKYAAVNRNNTASWFNDKPIYDGNKSCLWLCKETPYYAAVETIPGVWDASDWQNSLIERPVKETILPNWCKVGEWGFDPNRFVYFKIKQIDGMLVDVKEQGCNYVHQRQVSAFKRFKQARLRPYNADEMRSLVGKVIEDKIGNRCLITCFTVVNNKIVAFNKYCSADDLLKTEYTINGKPCGKLVHKRGDDWVE